MNMLVFDIKKAGSKLKLIFIPSNKKNLVNLKLRMKLRNLKDENSGTEKRAVSSE